MVIYFLISYFAGMILAASYFYAKFLKNHDQEKNFSIWEADIELYSLVYGTIFWFFVPAFLLVGFLARKIKKFL